MSNSAKCAFLIIGDEILCGKTKDSNLQTLALKLGEMGYEIGEVRVVPDEEKEIIKAVNELREKYFLVFTSGGIGPTHDDITTEAIAKALGAELETNAKAFKDLEEFYNNKNVEFNEARNKMAIVPKGCVLIANSISTAPGFKLQNVCVLAGIPSIFSTMLDAFLPSLPEGKKIYSLEISSNVITEGMIAPELTNIAKKYLGVVAIGSYPSTHQDGSHNLKITFRSSNLIKCEECKNECLELFEKR